MKMTIGKRVTIGFGIVVLLTGGLGVYTYLGSKTNAGLINSLQTESLPGLILSQQMAGMARENEINIFRAMTAGTGSGPLNRFSIA